MARPRLSSVRTGLLALVLLAGLPGLALTLYTGVDQRKAATLITQTETLQLVQASVAEEQRLIYQMQELLVGLAGRREVRQASPTCHKVLADLLRGVPQYANVGVADQHGNTRCSGARLQARAPIADAGYFQHALRTGRFALGDYQVDRLTGTPVVSGGYPLTDATGEVRGVVFAALRVDWLVQQAGPARLPAGSGLTVIDASGRILVRYPDTSGGPGGLPPEGSVARAVVGGRGAGTAELVGTDGVRRLFAFAPLSRATGGTPYPYVSISIPTAVAYARVNRLLISNLAGGALVALMALVAAWWGGELVLLRRLRALVGTARRLGAGDLGARTGAEYRAGELGQLAQTFDEMAGALQARDAEIRTLNADLEQRVALRTMELREAKAFLEHQIATSPGILFQIDSQRLCATYVSPNIERLLGYHPEEIVGNPVALAEIMHPEERADLMAPEREHRRRHGRPDLAGQDVELTREVRWRHKDGSYRWFAMALRVAHDEQGRPTFSLGHALDITARKTAEEAMLQARGEAVRANQAKSEFLSRMSHELRTPLNAILGFAQLLQMEVFEPQQQESVEQILKGGRHLLSMINEILDLTRLESGRLLAMSPEPVVVGEVVRECVDLITPMASEKRVHIRADDAGASPLAVLADRQRLKQVILNLLSNAVKYNHREGGVTISVAEPDAGRIQIAVTDTGSGIAESQLALLFRPFERLDAEEKHVEGTGLGLALSKRLVEAMGGSIGVESLVGVGSTFRVQLASADRVDVLALPALPIGTPAAGPARTVLYIEDNLANVRLLERILAHRPNIRLLTAMQGRLGLELIREHRPDVVLLDLDLADMRGDEVLRILQEDPQTSWIPVVVMSGTTDPRAFTRLRAAGACACLTKPLDAPKLLGLLDELLSAGVPPAEQVPRGSPQPRHGFANATPNRVL
jgi:PAS domain S-box-containing protein